MQKPCGKIYKDDERLEKRLRPSSERSSGCKRVHHETMTSKICGTTFESESNLSLLSERHEVNYEGNRVEQETDPTLNHIKHEPEESYVITLPEYERAILRFIF